MSVTLVHSVCPTSQPHQQLGRGRGLSRQAVQKATCTASLLLLCLLSATSYGQQALPRAGVSVRAATPEEVKQSIEAEDRLIQATPPIEGIPQRLAYYITRELPSLSVLGRIDATGETWQNATEHGQPSPFICFGDFDGNSLQDAAVVLRENGSGRLRVFAFHQIEISINPGNFTKLGYQAYEMASAGVDLPRAPLDNLAVLCNPPGTFQSVDGSVTLGLKNASILFGYSLYYFDGAYQSLLIED